jgi:hypothetical protein
MMTTERRYTAYRLANMAGCAGPDSATSAGADFLQEIADAVIERLEDGSFDDDTSHEIADSAIPVYTNDVWRTFADLCAWVEDPTELGFDGSDMEQRAKVCLYIIAERLVSAIRDDYTPDSDD